MPKPEAAVIAILLFSGEEIEWKRVDDDTTDEELLSWAGEVVIDCDYNPPEDWCLHLRWTTDHAIRKCQEWSDPAPDHGDSDDFSDSDPDDRAIMERENRLNSALAKSIEEALPRLGAGDALD